ncbi:MAG: hypothetical protein ACKVS5_13060 [Parvularculaceae bacterium]
MSQTAAVLPLPEAQARALTHKLLWGAVAAIALLSVFWRQNGATSDVSWLISMCARILDGERGWIDIFETTPPVPTLIYMPAVILSRMAGISSEVAVFALTYVTTFATLAFTARLLPATGGAAGSGGWRIIFPSAVCLFLFSNDAFAQREYFAALFCLPMFAIFVSLSEGTSWPMLPARVTAAALAGLAFAIKPPLFALPFIALATFELFRTRRIAFLFASKLPLSALIGVAITGASLALFPTYLGGVTTLMRDVYVPIRLPLAHGLQYAFLGTMIAAVAAAYLALRTPAPHAIQLSLTLASVFVAIYFAQGKYFSYHILPASLFAIIALGLTLGGGNRSAMHLVAGAAAAISASALLLAGFDDGRARLSDHSWSKHLTRPTAMAISPMISTSFPIAERIGARWVDRIHGQWVVHYTRIALGRDTLSEAERQRYQSYYDAELARTRAVIREKNPELIFKSASARHSWLVDALLVEDPTLLDNYDVFAHEGNAVILRRRDAVR